MNERIRELIKTKSTILFPGTDTVDCEITDIEKFAELIVAKVLDEVSTRAYVSGDRAWSDDVDRPWIELEFGFGKLHDAKTLRVEL